MINKNVSYIILKYLTAKTIVIMVDIVQNVKKIFIYQMIIYNVLIDKITQ